MVAIGQQCSMCSNRSFRMKSCKNGFWEQGMHSFALEHNPVRGRDMVWSDNHDGSGKNWLGLQLMLLRDQIREEERWSSWLKQHVNTSTGELLGSVWSNLVKSATRALSELS